MNKTIACLLLAGIVLTILHIPATAIHLAIITTLLLTSIKVLWSALQGFATPGRDLSIR